MRDTCMTARTLQLKLAAVMQQQVYQDYTALANYAAPDRLAVHVPLAHKVNYVLQLSLRLGLRLPSQKTMGTMTALLMYVPGSCLSKLSGCLQSSSGFFFLQAMHTTCPQSPIRVCAGMTELDPQAAHNMCVHMKTRWKAALAAAVQLPQLLTRLPDAPADLDAAVLEAAGLQGHTESMSGANVFMHVFSPLPSLAGAAERWSGRRASTGSGAARTRCGGEGRGATRCVPRKKGGVQTCG